MQCCKFHNLMKNKHSMVLSIAQDCLQPMTPSISFGEKIQNIDIKKFDHGIRQTDWGNFPGISGMQSTSLNICKRMGVSQSWIH